MIRLIIDKFINIGQEQKILTVFYGNSTFTSRNEEPNTDLAVCSPIQGESRVEYFIQLHFEHFCHFFTLNAHSIPQIIIQ